MYWNGKLYVTWDDDYSYKSFLSMIILAAAAAALNHLEALAFYKRCWRSIRYLQLVTIHQFFSYNSITWYPSLHVFVHRNTHYIISIFYQHNNNYSYNVFITYAILLRHFIGYTNKINSIRLQLHWPQHCCIQCIFYIGNKTYN